MVRKKNDDIPKSDFEVNESQDLLCFDSTENLGECIAAFSFGNSSDSDLDITPNNLYINNNDTNNIREDKTMVLNDNFHSNNKEDKTIVSHNKASSTHINDVNNLNDHKDKTLFDNRTTPIANGAAPLIKGQVPDIKRTYMLRSSTVRKLNELKSIHPDINVCVSTIVDIALDHYYKYITEEGGSQ
ncbi:MULTISPECIES: hypothetical protein [Clostridium]|uniref:hypothetical protein n=1 Tax=Clostridium TaxID=1485 RepID=UPI000F633B9B|nr:hypothetical protein [Clostridium carnis]